MKDILEDNSYILFQYVSYYGYKICLLFFFFFLSIVFSFPMETINKSLKVTLLSQRICTYLILKGVAL